ncbi:MAG: hypothetical protein R3F14_36260 [Polyangiaceae bacterium]
MAKLVRKTSTAVAETRTLPLARNLRDVTRACDADVPLTATDPRFQDFTAARGDDAVRGIYRELLHRPHGNFVHSVFLGHRGGGKTTEILRLIHRLGDGYSTAYLEATSEMNLFDIEVEDFLLSIVFVVERHLREVEGKPLPKDVIENVSRWFEEVVKTTQWARSFQGEASAGLELSAPIPFVSKLFGAVKALFKYDSHHRIEVRQVLRRYPGSLLQAVNSVLTAANKVLGERSLLVVVDNLDRYSPEIIDKLLVVEADRIRRLECNLVLTPPVSLLLQPKSIPLDKAYSCHDLCMVQLRAPDQRYTDFSGTGRDLMERALSLRLDLDTVMPDRAARDRLIAASGGAIRELIDLTHEAALLADNDPVIALTDVERAISKRRRRIRDLVNANGWIKALREIQHTKQISSDPAGLAALYCQLVFKYNGDGWYDIHPLAAELSEMRDDRLTRG